jgi:outer membrane protein OmpA-like peptidoglycan-associated protein
MMRALNILLLALAFAAHASAQNAFTIERISDLSGENAWLAGIESEGVILHKTQPAVNRLSDDARQNYDSFSTLLYPRGDSWSSYPGSSFFLFSPYRADAPLGTLSLANDSIAVFAIDRDHGSFKSGSILLGQYKNRQLTRLTAIYVAPAGVRCMHPAVQADTDQIVFSANLPGGFGGFDLYLINRNNDTWSAPINLGKHVNTGKNEVFPQWQGTQLYFSSDRDPSQKLDLYVTDRTTQWEQVDRLEAPFNSSGDDFQLIWLGENDALMSSDRAGQDDVYRLRRNTNRVMANNLRAELVCAGTPVQNANVRIFNDLNEVVLANTTGVDGGFNIGQLELKRRYRARFENIPESIVRSSLLYIINGAGERIMVFSCRTDGLFYFELMPHSDTDGLALIENVDQSRLLSVAIEGQVFEKEQGDLGAGELVYIVNDQGDLMALTYTGDAGYFAFDELLPEANYTFQLNNERAQNLVVFDGEEEVQLTVANGAARYERVQAGDRVQLVNERGERITIRNEELFVIRDIYYAFSSDLLNDTAKEQLRRLAQILKNNTNIQIELGSHTDSRGTDAFNQELSDRRAATCVNYLVNQGIALQRMRAKGYGESQLLNLCTDTVECDEAQHALNRRTEIKIKVNGATPADR